MRFQDNRLYFANSLTMKIVVTDRDGAFVKGYDLVSIFTKGIEDGSLAKAKEGLESYTENGLDGFNLDREGNMLFVLPVTGKACRLSPDGILTQFGKRGSGHGKFGIPSAIVADKAGNYYVTDKLRTMVIVFDKNLKFVKEFNYLGGRADSFAAPCVMAMSDDGKLYVGQVPKRGVLVYRVVNEE